VTIPAGVTVLLDVTPKAIYELDVFGSLVFDPSPSANIQLDTNLTVVHANASLIIGTEESPAMGWCSKTAKSEIHLLCSQETTR
jgi:hypothetical protein